MAPLLTKLEGQNRDAAPGTTVHHSENHYAHTPPGHSSFLSLEKRAPIMETGREHPSPNHNPEGYERGEKPRDLGN